MKKTVKNLTQDHLAEHLLVIDIENVGLLTTYSTSKIYLMISDDPDYGDPTFPKPIPMEGGSRKKGRRVVWILSEVLEWIVNQIKKSRGEAFEVASIKSNCMGDIPQ